MKMFNWLLVMVTAMLFSVLAFAQEVVASFPIPEGDIAKLLIQLATDYKTLGVLGIIIIITLVSVEVIKKFVSDQWKFKRLLVLGVSIVYSLLSGFVVQGSNVLTVIVTVFITSGGAMALYEALKGCGIIKKSV